MSLIWKDVIVTGGNVGIGRSTALELVKLGASVTIIGRNEQTCLDAIAEIKDNAMKLKVIIILLSNRITVSF